MTVFQAIIDASAGNVSFTANTKADLHDVIISYYTENTHYTLPEFEQIILWLNNDQYHMDDVDREAFNKGLRFAMDIINQHAPQRAAWEDEYRRGKDVRGV